MSSARICTKCNREHPLSYISAKCRWCSTLLTTQLCTYCKKWLPTDMYKFTKTNVLISGCRTCKTNNSNQYDKDHPEKTLARKRAWALQRRQAAEAKYEEWLLKTDKVFKPLKEADWIETCSYFGGCAVCGKEHIESRQFFVQFEEGGKYTTWNMFPMCAGCAHRPRMLENPFAWINTLISTGRITHERSDRLTEWLILQIEKET